MHVTLRKACLTLIAIACRLQQDAAYAVSVVIHGRLIRWQLGSLRAPAALSSQQPAVYSISARHAEIQELSVRHAA